MLLAFWRHTDPIYVIPLFFSSGPMTRIFVCLFVHPVLLEVGEAVGRGTKGDTVVLALRRTGGGRLATFEEAAKMIVEESLKDSLYKSVGH